MRLNKQRIGFIYLVILGAIALLIHVRLYEYAADDAYIHFRVARNFLDTGTPYYNLGEAVKVSTSSAWTLFITIILFILRGIDSQDQLPIVISIINSISTFMGMLVYTKLIRDLTKNTSNLFYEALFQITYIAILSLASIELMETSLALLVAGMGLYFLHSSKPISFVLFSVAAYLRIELVLLLALGFAFILVKKNIRLTDGIFYASLGLALFVVYDLYFFQTITPQSIKAKSIIYTLSRPDTLKTAVLSLFPTKIVLENQTTSYNTNLTMIFGLAMSMSYGSVFAFRNDRNLYSILFILWSLLISGLYILKHAFIFEWYIPLYTTPLLTSLVLSAYSKVPIQRVTAIVILFVMAIGNIYILTQTLYASCYLPANFQAFEAGSRVKMYKHIASILNTEYADKILLSSEIGGLGYGFTGTILDGAGLATPQALRYHPLSVPEERVDVRVGAIPAKFVEEIFPDVIVSYDIFATSLTKSDIIQNYNIVSIPAYLPEDQILTENTLIWESEYVRVYIRKDLPVSMRLLELTNEQ